MSLYLEQITAALSDTDVQAVRMFDSHVPASELIGQSYYLAEAGDGAVYNRKPMGIFFAKFNIAALYTDKATQELTLSQRQCVLPSLIGSPLLGASVLCISPSSVNGHVRNARNHLLAGRSQSDTSLLYPMVNSENPYMTTVIGPETAERERGSSMPDVELLAPLVAAGLDYDVIDEMVEGTERQSHPKTTAGWVKGWLTPRQTPGTQNLMLAQRRVISTYCTLLCAANEWPMDQTTN